MTIFLYQYVIVCIVIDLIKDVGVSVTFFLYYNMSYMIKSSSN